MDFWKRLKSLFSDSESEDAEQHNAAQSSNQNGNESGELVVHKVIERNEKDIAIYEAWKNSPERDEMLTWVATEYNKFCKSRACYEDCIDFLMIPSVNGFVLHYDPKRWDCDHFVSFFDDLKNSVRELGYWPHVSDVKTIRKGEKYETTQRYYLKPPRQFNLDRTKNEKINQHYGNIMITLCLINEKIVNLKFSATHYNDHLYQPPLDFCELMRTLCDTET